MKIRYTLTDNAVHITDDYDFIMLGPENEGDVETIVFHVRTDCDCELICDSCHEYGCGCAGDCMENEEGACDGSCEENCECEIRECEEYHVERNISPKEATSSRHSAFSINPYLLKEVELLIHGGTGVLKQLG